MSLFKVFFKVKSSDGFEERFLFADNVVVGDDHVIASKSRNFPSFRKTVIWNIPKDIFISSKKVREGV